MLFLCKNNKRMMYTIKVKRIEFAVLICLFRYQWTCRASNFIWSLTYKRLDPYFISANSVICSGIRSEDTISPCYSTRSEYEHPPDCFVTIIANRISSSCPPCYLETSFVSRKIFTFIVFETLKPFVFAPKYSEQ